METKIPCFLTSPRAVATLNIKSSQDCYNVFFEFQNPLIHGQNINLDLVEKDNNRNTRMHSSRMRTVRCSNHLVGGGGVVCPGGVCLPGGCLLRGDVCPGWCLPGGMCLPGGVSSQGVCLPRGVSAQGVSAHGGCLPGGCLPRGCLPRGVSATLPCEQNHRCLAATTLRTVITHIEIYQSYLCARRKSRFSCNIVLNTIVILSITLLTSKGNEVDQ